MKRREALLATSSMAISAAIGLACGGNNVLAQATPAPTPPMPPRHHHGGDRDLIEAATTCIARGDACLAHCIALLSGGDQSMAGCAATVFEMRAVMQGLSAVAASSGKHLPELARVASQFCKDCLDECQKHAAVHTVCKDCADACTKTIAACAKYA